MRGWFRAVLAVSLLVLPGCGGDRTERGLAPANEEAVPESERELSMTEAERRARMDAEESVAEEEAFDRAMDE